MVLVPLVHIHGAVEMGIHEERIVSQRTAYPQVVTQNKPLTLIYDKEKNTWNASAEGQTFELITMNEDGTITFKLISCDKPRVGANDL